MLKVGDNYRVCIEDTNIYGNGVCHIDNKVVFVEKAVLGDVCEIEITEICSKYAYAKLSSLVNSSSNRIEPCCEHYKKCGGCSFLHVTCESENHIKEEYVKKSFQKHGLSPVVEKISCPVSEKYRNKVVLFFDGESFGYMEGGTNEIVPHRKCLLNDDLFDEIATETAKLLKNAPIRALYLRKSSKETPEIMICPILYSKTNLDSYAKVILGKFPEIKTILVAVSDDEKLLLEKVSFETIYGDGTINDEICGISFRISPESFYQVNHNCAEKLYNKAIELAGLEKGMVCADLFCGTGTIGIISAKSTGASVYGVEIVEKAIEDAKYNARLNKVKNAYFEAMDACKFDKKVDVAIIDPPRKGCSSYMIKTLLNLKPKKIVYISCNTDTQVRDVKLLSEYYEFSSSVYPFNLFPRTSHVESVVCLTRRIDN